MKVTSLRYSIIPLARICDFQMTLMEKVDSIRTRLHIGQFEGSAYICESSDGTSKYHKDIYARQTRTMIRAYRSEVAIVRTRDHSKLTAISLAAESYLHID